MNGFIIPVNFGGLSEGDYTIELVDAKGSKVEKVSFKAEALKNVYVSRLASDRSKFLLSVPNSGNETITVKIYDSENNLLLSDSKEINGDFAQVFKVTSATAGYTFEVKNAAGNTKTLKF
jgi:hypothetical protein